MKKPLLLFVAAGLLSFNALAQTGACVTNYYHQEALRDNPQIAIVRQQLENYTEHYIQQQSARRGTAALPYIIPVVFHVLHNYGPENLPDSVLIEAVRLMNLDYRKLNADTTLIVPIFQPIAADCEIEFRLATLDPNGGCTTGIEHIPTLKTYGANNASKLNPWPNNKYLNIWIAASLERAGAAAWAYLPGEAPASTLDGVLCWYTYADNIQNTITHEVGHCLNLSHPWGDTNDPEVACGDDGVGDTPITMGWAPGHCNLNGQVCTPGVIENVQNYMDYSYCDRMFTAGQKARMHACLTSNVEHRDNLWTNTNLIATGTDGGPPQVCVPRADFKSNDSYACAGDSVYFTDLSWNAVVTGWNWSFPGGSPSTSTVQHPSVLYANAGIYSATLIATTSAGSDTVIKSNVIRITANALNTIPYVQSFEDTTGFPGNDGFVSNPDNGATWSRVTNAATTGTASIKMNNYVSLAGAVDEWVTPSMDFSNMNAPVTLSFKVANAQRNSTSNDQLKVFYSTNCGQSWNASYGKSGAALSTAGVVTSNFTPSLPSQWRQELVYVNPVHNQAVVRFKFQSTSDHGNNIYIDDINITGVDNAVNELDELQGSFILFPNPTDGVSNIMYSLSKTSQVRIEIKDIIGQTVSVILNETVGAGSHDKMLPVLSPGIYLIDVMVNNKHHVRKLVVS